MRQGWSLRALSDRTAEVGEKIDFTVLARYERGEQHPQPRKLPVLAKALYVEVDDLFADAA